MSIGQSGKNIKPKLWFISEHFYPDEVSTGYILTKLAEGLSNEYDVRAITSRQKKSRLLKFQIHKGIKIYRCLSTALNRKFLLFRIINSISFTISILFKSLILISRKDLVLTVTNPPVLPYFVLLSALIKRAYFIFIIHDVYPDLMAALGMIKPNSPVFKIWDYLNGLVLKKSDLVIVLSHDMKIRVSQKLKHKVASDKIYIVPNWAETDIISPFDKTNNQIIKSLNLVNNFVIQYAGNFGRPNDIETIIEAAKALKHEEDIHFIFAGDGAKREWVEKQKRKYKLDNVTLLNQYERKDQYLVLNASDISFVSLIGGMKGVSAPSRFYNILASGRPIIAIMEDGTDVANIIKDEGIGWVISPGNKNALINAILKAKIDPLLKYKGIKARKVAEEKFCLDRTLLRYRILLKKLQDSNPECSFHKYFYN